MDTVHFLASVSSAICGENRLGLTVTRKIEKVTCKGCLAALAVTTLVNPDAVIDPELVEPKPTETEEETE